jgi:aryl-alcohol dehydrogenase-like predicted oxidoreductase
MTLPRRTLGRNGPSVSALGLGCMGMSQSYGTGDERESIATIDRALELGITFLDTADVYGPHTNELLVGRAIRGRREQVFLATKFGLGTDAATGSRTINGSPEYVRAAAEASRKRLGVDTIDLYYLHRVDPRTPIEDTVRAMARLVEEGTVRYLGLSEVSPATLDRAHRVHPITAVQSEYSLWTRDPEDGLLAKCRELGVGLVPFSPLGRGFFSGKLRSVAGLGEDDFRRTLPRFEPGNFDRNLARIHAVEALARTKGCTPAQLSLAWVLAQGEHIAPIPGSKRRAHLEENAGALEVRLSPEELRTLDSAWPRGAAAGDRYGPEAMLAVNR